MKVLSVVNQKVSKALVGVLRQLQCSRIPKVSPELVPFEGEIKDVRFFIGTKTGLMYFDGRELWRLFKGRVYGITHYNGRWYTTWNHRVTLGRKPLATMASILSFRFDDEQITDLRVEAAPLDQEIHQIDAWHDHLFVTDTAHNRVIAYRIGARGCRKVAEHYPNGRLTEGKSSPNFAHINSVFRQDGNIHLVYHNQTEKTERNSEIAILRSDWHVEKILQTEARCAHNVFCDGGVLVYCDSMNGRLVRHGAMLFEEDIYLRGLAIADKFWIVGGSAFAERDERNTTTGYLYQLDPIGGSEAARMRIPGCGSVYEIRLIETPDRGMSQYAMSLEYGESA